MGQVYLGERQDGAYQRRVAIKVIHPWMATVDLVERLCQERQILAGLRHPAIVSLLDGGAMADGVPYLVMDYVDGQAIDHFC